MRVVFQNLISEQVLETSDTIQVVIFGYKEGKPGYYLCKSKGFTSNGNDLFIPSDEYRILSVGD